MHGAGCYLDKQVGLGLALGLGLGLGLGSRSGWSRGTQLPATKRLPHPRPSRPIPNYSNPNPNPNPKPMPYLAPPSLSHPPCHAAQGVSWKGKFYNGMGPGLPTNATFLAA